MSGREIVIGLKNNVRNLWPLFRYLFLRTETHAFCLALSAAALLGFYPFCSMLLWLTRHASLWLHNHSPEWVWWEWNNVYNFTREAIYLFVPTSFIKGNPIEKDFLIHNLDVSVSNFRASSIFWILLGAAAVFVPLEAGFNRLWRAEKDRSYWHNQAVGFALTVVCCVIAMAFVAVNSTLRFGTGFLFSLFQDIVEVISFHQLSIPDAVQSAFNTAILKVEWAGFFFLVILILYKYLPNTKVRAVEVLPAALLAGVTAQIVQTAYVFILPSLDIRNEYGSQGPFFLPVNFLLLTYFETFVVLGGAFLATQPRNLSEVVVLPGLQPAPEEAVVTEESEEDRAADNPQ
ncbi:MAG TPA: YihY/virulence factor BrkB family protein [Terriglobia bacterium]|nr:YihY/virulence factor BrkB family protein [Terriglobia bacterium]